MSIFYAKQSVAVFHMPFSIHELLSTKCYMIQQNDVANFLVGVIPPLKSSNVSFF